MAENINPTNIASNREGMGRQGVERQALPGSAVPGPAMRGPMPPGPALQPRGSRGVSAIVEWLTVTSITLFITITFPITLWFCFKIVQEYERAVIFRLGRVKAGGARGPGIFFVMPWADNYMKVDLRTVSFDVPPQEVITKDSVSIMVDAVVFYRVNRPLLAMVAVANHDHATRFLASTMLRNVIGTNTLAELLADRQNISRTMQVALDAGTDPWGVKVEHVEITDVKLPAHMQKAMAAEAEAAREARAKLAAAEGEMRASKALKEASDIMADASGPGALQLRYLQTLTQLAIDKKSTILFPLPLDLFTAFTARGGGGTKPRPSIVPTTRPP